MSHELSDAPSTRGNAIEFSTSQRIKLRPESWMLLKPNLTVAEFLDLLRAKHHHADARRVLAHALPKRHALWWGCLCAWEAYRPEPHADILEILQTVTAYIQEPTNDRRWRLYRLGRAMGFHSLTGQLAMAAFCSGGSLGLQELAVSPRPYLTGRLVGVAVYLASVRRDPARYKERLQQFLALGLEIASGDNLWPMPEPMELETPRAVPALPESVPSGAENMAHEMA